MKMIALLPCLLVFSFGTVAQQSRPVQSLSYSGVVLNLGDAEQGTLDRLKKRFQVQSFKKADTPDLTNYLVMKKQSDEVVGFEVVGAITFRHGLLVKAYRDWTPIEPSAYSLVLAIKGAVDTLRKDGSGCGLDTGSVQEPNYSNQSSYIVCGLKSIEISGTQSSQLKSGTAAHVGGLVQQMSFRKLFANERELFANEEDSVMMKFIVFALRCRRVCGNHSEVHTRKHDSVARQAIHRCGLRRHGFHYRQGTGQTST
jgi:hypothetical protein